MKKIILIGLLAFSNLTMAQTKTQGCLYYKGGPAKEIPFEVEPKGFRRMVAHVDDDIDVFLSSTPGWSVINYSLQLNYKKGEVIITDVKSNYTSGESTEPVVLEIAGSFKGNYLKCRYDVSGF